MAAIHDSSAQSTGDAATNYTKNTTLRSSSKLGAPRWLRTISTLILVSFIGQQLIKSLSSAVSHQSCLPFILACSASKVDSENRTLNVLCNGRCSCVLLELFAPNKSVGQTLEQTLSAFLQDESDEPEDLAEQPAEQSADWTESEATPEPTHNKSRTVLGRPNRPQQQPVAASSERVANGPHLYAPLLYSSQMAKLSYQPQTAYLIPSSGELSSSSISGGGINGTQQQLQRHTSMSASSSVSSASFLGQPLVGSETLVAAAEASTLAPPLPPGGQQTHPFHHHPRMGANYLPHHLRPSQQQQPDQKLAASKNLPINANLNSMAHKLIPLKRLEMKLLNDHQQQQHNNNNNHSSNPAEQNYTTTATSSNSRTDIPANYYNETGQSFHDNPQLIESLQLMMSRLEENEIESLLFRHNEMRFELWSEVYALLATSRAGQHLLHLDLSHNALGQLGFTFTGYIEHHLAQHGSWPTQTQAGRNQSQTRRDALSTSNARLRHSSQMLTSGRLFGLVQARLAQTNQSHKVNQTTTTTKQQQMLAIAALDLSHNQLKRLINDQFRALKFAQSIRLDHNKLRYIHQHAFAGLESLRYLNLNFNQLQVIYVEQFQTNYNLVSLRVRSNFLAFLRGGSFASLSKLRRLDLARNKLTIVSSNAFVGLESLELLNCSSNQFVHAPSASLHPLTNLRRLDLSDNLISQLAPGSFFHLPIEEIGVNGNEQLVSIDRGAFWDLPYLRRLDLRANPMLMSINSQAFVGTPSLQSIELDELQSLEPSARQMLDNITMAATARLLRLEQTRANLSQVAPATQKPVEVLQLASNSTSQRADLKRFSNLAAEQVKSSKLEQEQSKLNYLYYLGSLIVLLAALKLVFKYTSTSHLMESRRGRRRVYDANKSSSSTCSSSSSPPPDVNSLSSAVVEAYQMYGQQSVIEQVEQENESDSVNESKSNKPHQTIVDVDDEIAANHRLDDNAQHSSQCQLSAEQEEEDEQDDDDNNISVITSSHSMLTLHLPSSCCPNCSTSQQAQREEQAQIDHSPTLPLLSSLSPTNTCSSTEQQSQVVVVAANSDEAANESSATTLDLIQSQLIAAGLDYGHLNCAHFYQSLAPALADMSDNFDYY